MSLTEASSKENGKKIIMHREYGNTSVCFSQFFDKRNIGSEEASREKCGLNDHFALG